MGGGRLLIPLYILREILDNCPFCYYTLVMLLFTLLLNIRNEHVLATGKLQHLINTYAHKAIVSGSGSGIHELPSSAEQAGVALQRRINKII